MNDINVGWLDRFTEYIGEHREAAAFFVIAVFWFIPIFFGMYYKLKYKDIKGQLNEIVNTIKTDTITKIDYESLFYVRPIVYKEKVIKRDTVRLMNEKQDSVNVVVPITQKVYKKDSVYTAWISGYELQLDSIDVYQKVITNTVVKNSIVYRKDKFTVGPSVSFGYDVVNKRFVPMIGFSIQYNLFNLK